MNEVPIVVLIKTRSENRARAKGAAWTGRGEASRGGCEPSVSVRRARVPSPRAARAHGLCVAGYLAAPVYDLQQVGDVYTGECQWGCQRDKLRGPPD